MQRNPLNVTHDQLTFLRTLPLGNGVLLHHEPAVVLLQVEPGAFSPY